MLQGSSFMEYTEYVSLSKELHPVEEHVDDINSGFGITCRGVSRRSVVRIDGRGRSMNANRNCIFFPDPRSQLNNRNCYQRLFHISCFFL